MADGRSWRNAIGLELAAILRIAAFPLALTFIVVLVLPFTADTSVLLLFSWFATILVWAALMLAYIGFAASDRSWRKVLRGLFVLGVIGSLLFALLLIPAALSMRA